MTDPMLQALREEIVALRELLDQTERKARHDYEALQGEYEAVLLAQMAAATDYPLTPFATRSSPVETDASCPF